MKNPKLTEKESYIYLKIVTNGTMNDMFEFGYAIGRERLAREQLAVFNKEEAK